MQDENLSTHLLSPEFFDAERTPEHRASPPTDIRRTGDEVTVDGELTIKGITQPVELTGTISDPIQDAYGNDRIGLTLETTIDRTQFGLNWNLPAPERRARARERRDADRRALPGEGVTTMKVLGISGSLRRDSYNTALLRNAPRSSSSCGTG